MCGLSSHHDHYPYMYLVSVLFKSSCIYSLNPTSHSFFSKCFLLVYITIYYACALWFSSPLMPSVTRTEN